MKRALATLGAAMLALTLTPATARAGYADHDTASTNHWYIPGEGGYYWVNMRLFYEDNGGTVTLRRIRVWMPNVRPTEHADGYYFDNMYVKCERNNGTTDWFFSPSNTVLITDDAQDFTIDPNNMDCGEDNVVYGGTGIINQQPAAPDLNDEFGYASGNHLPE